MWCLKLVKMTELSNLNMCYILMKYMLLNVIYQLNWLCKQPEQPYYNTL